MDADLGCEWDVRNGFVCIMLQFQRRLVFKFLEDDAHHTLNASNSVDQVYTHLRFQLGSDISIHCTDLVSD